MGEEDVEKPFCRHCNEVAIILREIEQTFKNGTTHQRLDCGKCGGFLKYKGKECGDGDFIWPLGKKHSGKTLNEIYQEDGRYLNWVRETFSDGPLKTQVIHFLKTKS